MQRYPTGEAEGMELLLHVRLEIFAFDTLVARLAQRTIELMVVACAERVVINDVEIIGGEGLVAGFADEALLVVSTREPTIGRADRLAPDDLATATAISFVARRHPSGRQPRPGRAGEKSGGRRMGRRGLGWHG